MQGRYFATHVTLKVRQLGLSFKEFGATWSCWVIIFGAVSNKDVSMFLSMLRLSSVCDTVIPLWFSENDSTSGVLIYTRFPKVSGGDWG